jgi:hypothetical protein
MVDERLPVECERCGYKTTFSEQSRENWQPVWQLDDGAEFYATCESFTGQPEKCPHLNSATAKAVKEHRSALP